VWLLMSLHSLLLHSVLLLELLRLLSVALLHLLLLRFTSVFLGCLLVIFFLLLLQLLVFLILFSSQFVLLLLIFLLRCRLGGGRSRVFVGLNFTGMRVGINTCCAVVCRTSFIPSRRPLRSLVRGAGFLCGFCVALKISRPGGGCDRRLASIRRGTQLRVGTSLLHMLVLCRNRGGVAFPVVALFLRRRPLVDSAIATVIADAVSRVVFDPAVVGVVDVAVVYAID